MKYVLLKGQTSKIQSTVYTDNGLSSANLTGASIQYMFKKNPSDLDSVALLTKNIGSGVTIISASDGTVECLLTAADTNTMSYPSIFFEILVKLSNGNYIRSGIEEIVFTKTLIQTLN